MKLAESLKPSRNAALLLIASCTLIGCSPSMPFGDVSGQATLDGRPIQYGDVRFVPLDGQLPTAGSLIENGHFATRVPIGQCRVEISASDPPMDPRQSKGGKRNAMIERGALPPELIPARYNANSELRLDIHSGSNEARFDLKSK